MDNAARQTAFKEAVDRNDFTEFNKQYIDFLKQFDSFAQAFSITSTEVHVTSAIFGRHNFYLKQTNDAQAQELLDKARAASQKFAIVPVQERLKFLKILKSKIDKYQDDIALAITADTGKPIDLSKGEMTKGNEWFQFAANQAALQLVGTKPLGVAQVISAYNYPYALAISGIVGALAAGNSVVVSAPLKAPNWVFPFMQAAMEAMEEYGIQGLIQTSIGVNNSLTAAVDIVHFVGGDRAGEQLRKSRGAKKIIREMGGSNVVVVMASALEKQSADDIANIIYGGFGPAAGQRCTAPRMLCAQNGAEEAVKALEALCEKGPLPHQDIGNPFAPGVKIGPLVDKSAHQKMQGAINLATELGARVYGKMGVSDKVRPKTPDTVSLWVNPVVIDWSAVDMSKGDNAARVHECVTNEIFGPLLHILPTVKTLDEAIAVTGRLDTHGLAGAIFTASNDDENYYRQHTRITSIMRNAAPKDQSPKFEHGHPGMPRIGGSHHFQRYADLRQTPR